jgi:hypothetical protein
MAKFEDEVKKIRERAVLMEERARIAVAQATISRSNLEHKKSLEELKKLDK